MSLIDTLYPKKLISELEVIKKRWEKSQNKPVFKPDTERASVRDETTASVLAAVASGVDFAHEIGQLVGKKPNTVRTHLYCLMAQGLVVQLTGGINPANNRRLKDRFYIKQKEAA